MTDEHAARLKRINIKIAWRAAVVAVALLFGAYLMAAGGAPGVGIIAGTGLGIALVNLASALNERVLAKRYGY